MPSEVLEKISYQTFCCVVSLSTVFLRVVPYFGEPVGRVKIQTTSKRLIEIYYPTRQIGMFVRANFVDIYLQGMRDKSM